MTPRWRLLLGGGMHCCAALLFVALFLLLPQTRLRTGTTSFQQPDAGQVADDLPAAVQPPSPLPTRTPSLPLSPGFKVVDVQRYEWSPDSQWLVFNTLRDIDDPEFDTHSPPTRGLWIAGAGGTNAHLLYKIDGWRVILSPNWSTNSTLVLSAVKSFSSDNSETAAHQVLRLFEAATGRELALEDVPDWMPGVNSFGMTWFSDHQQLFVTQGGDSKEPLTTYRLTLMAQ